jgi:hypothetical protein
LLDLCSCCANTLGVDSDKLLTQTIELIFKEQLKLSNEITSMIMRNKKSPELILAQVPKIQNAWQV